MKTKLNNKTEIVLTIIAIFLFILIMCGCNLEPRVKPNPDLQGFEIVVIDSCEYLSEYRGSCIGYRFAHKGNCKFCSKRNTINYCNN